jgi:hypothetical protein
VGSLLGRFGGLRPSKPLPCFFSISNSFLFSVFDSN